jgi:hypothetical protein
MMAVGATAALIAHVTARWGRIGVKTRRALIANAIGRCKAIAASAIRICAPNARAIDRCGNIAASAMRAPNARAIRRCGMTAVIEAPEYSGITGQIAKCSGTVKATSRTSGGSVVVAGAIAGSTEGRRAVRRPPLLNARRSTRQFKESRARIAISDRLDILLDVEHALSRACSHRGQKRGKTNGIRLLWPLLHTEHRSVFA